MSVYLARTAARILPPHNPENKARQAAALAFAKPIEEVGGMESWKRLASLLGNTSTSRRWEPKVCNLLSRLRRAVELGLAGIHGNDELAA